MPLTGTLKDVLSINHGDGFSVNELREISNHVLSEPYGPQVWKAFTGPEDTPGQTDYRLWVEPINSRVIPRQSKFQVVECTVTWEIGAQFQYIFRVSVIPLA